VFVLRNGRSSVVTACLGETQGSDTFRGGVGLAAALLVPGVPSDGSVTEPVAEGSQRAFYARKQGRVEGPGGVAVARHGKVFFTMPVDGKQS